MNKWKLVKSKTVLNTKWLTVKRNDYDIVKGVVKKNYYDVTRPDYVLVVAKSEVDSIILVKQYRRSINQTIWEVPAGWINKGETPIQAAERELREETGYLGKGKLLGSLIAQPGFMDMQAYVVEVDIVNKVETNFDDDEEIIQKIISLDKVVEMIKSNKVRDMGTIAAINLFLLKSKF